MIRREASLFCPLQPPPPNPSLCVSLARLSTLIRRSVPSNNYKITCSCGIKNTQAVPETSASTATATPARLPEVPPPLAQSPTTPDNVSNSLALSSPSTSGEDAVVVTAAEVEAEAEAGAEAGAAGEGGEKGTPADGKCGGNKEDKGEEEEEEEEADKVDATGVKEEEDGDGDDCSSSSSSSSSTNSGSDGDDSDEEGTEKMNTDSTSFNGRNRKSGGRVKYANKYDKLDLSVSDLNPKLGEVFRRVHV